MARPWLALAERVRRGVGRIRTRLLIVNLVVVLVPIAGLEFARLYEHQLLDGLERDMQNQAVLVKTSLEAGLARGEAFGTPEQEAELTAAALQTRTRIRLFDAERGLLVDSHRNGPPEGKEPHAPLLTGGRAGELERAVSGVAAASSVPDPEGPLAKRRELLDAFQGKRSTATRVARRPSAVFLFLAEPVRYQRTVRGAVYVTRSTTPVLQEMHRIRRGLTLVLALALALTAGMTLLLAWTISRPLERLAHAARRIAAGDSGLDVPVVGGGEIGELADAFREMTRKLEARHRYISAFAADVAHEFKSPLTSIRGAAELLAEGAADDLDARQRFLQNIALDAARLDRLVSRLLELSRIDASDESPVLVDLEALVRRAVERSQGPDGSVALEYTSSIPVIFARPADLETALLNLLDNALKFSPPGAPVIVQVEGRAGERFVTIAVEDRGSGIPESHLSRVFERFFTTDADRSGTGLGLAIVKSVVEALGGSIEVRSAVGQGTRFTLRLPARAR
ncbi:MAG TPA: HAMP domain-containing sensor histidine kinase [Polyangiaceae bacterium]|nr:HAMP domain-containing sensor histidine kinase [Polyangiaceae bacterium]